MHGGDRFSWQNKDSAVQSEILYLEFLDINCNLEMSENGFIIRGLSKVEL